jgi:hypothetical protein
MAARIQYQSARVLIVAVFILCTSTALPEVRAEIVLDEFVDPVQIALPEMSAQYQIQHNIGPLGADRWVDGEACCFAKPAGHIDVNTSFPSGLYTEISSINPDPTAQYAAIGVNVLYYFNTVDATQGAVNDRVVVDFAYLRSTVPVYRITIAIQDQTDNYVSQIFNVAPQDREFSLEFPFRSFSVRGGGAGSLDPQHVRTLYLSFAPLYYNAVDPFNFSAAIERIRLTSAIPEPDAQSIIAIAVVIGIWWTNRKRRCSYETCNDFAPGYRNRSHASSEHGLVTAATHYGFTGVGRRSTERSHELHP